MYKNVYVVKKNTFIWLTKNLYVVKELAVFYAVKSPSLYVYIHIYKYHNLCVITRHHT